MKKITFQKNNSGYVVEDRWEAGNIGLVQSRLADRETDGFNSYLRAGTHSLW